MAETTTRHGMQICADLVPSKGGDFGTITVRGNGASFGVWPLSADDLIQIADQISNVAMRLRASEQDRQRFLSAIAADEMSEAA